MVKIDMLFREIVKKLNISILEKIEENVDKLKFFNFKYMGKTYQFIRRSRDELFLFTLDTNNGEDEMVIDILSPSKIFPLVKGWNDNFPIALEIGDFEYLCNYDERNASGIIVSPHHQNQSGLIDELKKNSDRIHYMIGKLHGRKLFFFREGINENLVIIYERTDKFYNEIDDVEKVQEIFNTLDDKSDFLQVIYLEFYTEEEIKRDLDEKRRYWLSNIKNNLNSIKRIYIEHTDSVFLFEREKDGQLYVLIYGKNMKSAESHIEYDESIMIDILTKVMGKLPLDVSITIDYRDPKDNKKTVDRNEENNNESLTFLQV